MLGAVMLPKAGTSKSMPFLREGTSHFPFNSSLCWTSNQDGVRFTQWHTPCTASPIL